MCTGPEDPQVQAALDNLVKFVVQHGDSFEEKVRASSKDKPALR